MGADATRIIPELTDAQWDRMRRYGVPVEARPGDVLFQSGEAWYDLILVESGAVDVVREALAWVGV